ncbi:hypothetical protein BT69DRAFT_1213485 [Atractiella rhizophila]|nr:hypothetical protein BT69DRAFT_1213485 [Atractiella rhizophila]
MDPENWPSGPSWSERTTADQYRPFRGMYYDVVRRLPFWISDWTLASSPSEPEKGARERREDIYRVLAGGVKMYFINLMPALAYTLDMNYRTDGAYGVNESILASALAALVFSIFSVQPLTIVGVTGLINLFNYTNYDIVTVRHGVNFLQFQAWVLIWAALFHWIVAIFNICDLTRFITDMTSETQVSTFKPKFGFYVGVIYVQKGIELLILEFDHNTVSAGWLATLIAILFSLSVYYLQKVGDMPFGPFRFREAIADYGFIIGCVFWTGFAHFPGNIKSTHVQMLPITKSWFPTMDRDWVVDFWNLPVKWVFVAMPFGLLIMLLFYFDHNVSSLMAQARAFPIKRPAGFHWDFFLLGIVTFVSGILGLPAPNGLVPQAPVHTESLSVLRQVDVETVIDEKGRSRRFQKLVRERVVEQRLSHLIIGLLTLGTLTRPLLVVLGLIPRALFAGVFIVVGWGSIEGNGIVHKTLYLFRDQRLTEPSHPLLSVSRTKILLYVVCQWVVFAIAVATSQTLAAISFPVYFVWGLIPFRTYICPKLFSPQELAVLDAPTANSFAVLVSLGGSIGSHVSGETIPEEREVEEGRRGESTAVEKKLTAETRPSSRRSLRSVDRERSAQEVHHIQRIGSIER